ncbi:MAG: hypothetical protein ACQCN6_04735 [Candidatus Bathyarchaeia archaeon]
MPASSASSTKQYFNRVAGSNSVYECGRTGWNYNRLSLVCFLWVVCCFTLTSRQPLHGGEKHRYHTKTATETAQTKKSRATHQHKEKTEPSIY